MALIVWGTRHFKKQLGPKGVAYPCPNCGKVYQDNYVKISKWGHLEYIPLIPLETFYIHYCPVCGFNGKFDNNRIAKDNIDNSGESNQNLELRGIYHKSVKPRTYDLFVDDKNSGETFTIGRNVSKDEYNNILNCRLLKKIPLKVD